MRHPANKKRIPGSIWNVEANLCKHAHTNAHKHICSYATLCGISIVRHPANKKSIPGSISNVEAVLCKQSHTRTHTHAHTDTRTHRHTHTHHTGESRILPTERPYCPCEPHLVTACAGQKWDGTKGVLTLVNIGRGGKSHTRRHTHTQTHTQTHTHTRTHTQTHT
jgi:hypothetical protein